jgi:hypothetical protein
MIACAECTECGFDIALLEKDPVMEGCENDNRIGRDRVGELEKKANFPCDKESEWQYHNAKMTLELGLGR